jgi:hypothetical protein
MMRADNAIQQLSTEGTYVGYEKYQKEYVETVRWNDMILVGVLTVSLLT